MGTSSSSRLGRSSMPPSMRASQQQTAAEPRSCALASSFKTIETRFPCIRGYWPAKGPCTRRRTFWAAQRRGASAGVSGSQVVALSGRQLCSEFWLQSAGIHTSAALNVGPISSPVCVCVCVFTPYCMSLRGVCMSAGGADNQGQDRHRGGQ